MGSSGRLLGAACYGYPDAIYTQNAVGISYNDVDGSTYFSLPGGFPGTKIQGGVDSFATASSARPSSSPGDNAIL